MLQRGQHLDDRVTDLDGVAKILDVENFSKRPRDAMVLDQAVLVVLNGADILTQAHRRGPII